MNFIGNILWMLFGGLILSIGWAVAGLLWCITIIGIPIGLQCFKLASLALLPFGRRVETGGGPVSLVLNILWIIFSGIPLALGHVMSGILCGITIIGIPFAKQHFKLAALALTPFGARIV